jgi:hypothetical protein
MAFAGKTACNNTVYLDRESRKSAHEVLLALNDGAGMFYTFEV